jgi:hypothetical protein
MVQVSLGLLSVANLKKRKFRKDILHALTQLPKTLDETYERILCGIIPENRPYVRKVLHLLSYDFGMEYQDQIHTALAVDTELLEYRKDDPPCDPLAIIDICTCLITSSERSSRTEIKLAHYTVKEYLVSDRVCIGPAAYFELSEAEANAVMTKAFLVYMLSMKMKGDSTKKDFEHSALRRWRLLLNRVILADKKDPGEPIARLTLNLLNPLRPGFDAWLAAMLPCFSQGGYNNGMYEINRTWAPCGLPDWIPKPGMEVCHRLAWLCWFDLYPSARIFLDEYLVKISFDKPFATTGHVGTDGAVTLANATSYRSITVIDVAARLQNTSFINLFECFADESFESKASMAAMESVLCKCPEDVHPPGKHLGSSSESLVAIKDILLDSNNIITPSQLMFLSLDNILSTILEDVSPRSTLRVLEENVNFDIRDAGFDLFFDGCPEAETKSVYN